VRLAIQTEQRTLSNTSITVTAIPGIPLIQEGDDLGTMLGDALEAADLRPERGDVLVVTHKIISKAEGRSVSLVDIQPSEQAIELAKKTNKDPALVELILSESRTILRHRPGLIIAEHRFGMVMANAGIDQSNVASDGDDQQVLLLPRNPDASSVVLRDALEQRFQTTLAVIVADSVGRAWRNGIVGLAIGASGLPALMDLRGRRDLDGRELQVTQVGLADQIASAAELLMGEADEGTPAVLVRGLNWEGDALPARALIREPSEDLFR
jgi:coenzyme F420-0:L-glutamate ligase/coenzyme F420-1:gamma-L-glutamate ligase